MIKHIVMFRLNDFSTNEKSEHIERLTSELRALPEKIDVIRSYEVGVDCLGSPRSYDIVLIGEFDDLEALNKYSVHPEHQRVVKYIRSIAQPSVVVDFKM